MVISGLAYGQRATLEVNGEALTWRAHPVNELPENIATTVHDVTDSHWIEQRASIPGMVLVAVGGVWIYMYGIVEGAIAAAAGVGLLYWRRAHPRRLLVLDLGARRLVLHVDALSASHARALVDRITQVLESGETPSSPPSLP